ncbi:MAG: hypothetical protein AAGK23_05490 [Pseudomonadota bacterium]
MRFWYLGVAAGLFVPMGVAELPEPLKSAVERSNDGPVYPFDIERTSTDTGEDGETVTGYARVDLGAPEFKQITPAHLIDESLPGSSFRALSGIEGALEDGIWCTRFGDNLPDDIDDIEIVEEDEATITYEFKPKPDEDADGPEKKILRRSLARLTVAKDDPAVLKYSSGLTRTVTLYVVAKVRQLDLTATCARAPDGRTYITESTQAFEASGFGDGGGNNSQMAITALYDPETGQQITP